METAKKVWSLKGKKALVTGSTQGIGYEIAKKLVEVGAEVWVHCTSDTNKACRVASAVGAVGGVACNLGNFEETASLFSKTGSVDVLVLNASVQYKECWEDASPEHFEEQINVNLRSTFQLLQAYYPSMKEKGEGRIITIGSVNQYRQHRELPIYAATKCAVMSLVKNVAKYAAPYGVTVNNVSPGAINTPRNADILNNPELLQKINSAIPAGRFGESEEVAKAVLMLCGDGSGYITGTDIIIDGGMRL